ncbi:uncharacterized protein LOC123298453 isoform X1 [Chrysoperla carnea]|uniref:uncharacterized protein LOC123298453 isoform X1 n=1 Tax=Chrysoperla carnea TaxID=189513 RepID=UPI001D064744|nr:uncharacterized protein LOC123298453 isoform X1 [Chrysoperla carnea]
MASNNLAMITFSLTIFSSIVAIAWACNGYSLKINEIKSCGGPDQIITLSDDFTVWMDDDCNIITKGCAKVKAFKTAVGKYKAVKAPLPPFAGEIDLCEAVVQYADLVDPFFELLALPKRCPVDDMDYCLDGTKKVSIAKYKKKLSMAAGKIDVQLNVTHDTGVSCTHVNLEIIRPKKG